VYLKLPFNLPEIKRNSKKKNATLLLRQEILYIIYFFGKIIELKKGMSQAK
jgi:hypothetical protein